MKTLFLILMLAVAAFPCNPGTVSGRAFPLTTVTMYNEKMTPVARVPSSMFGYFSLGNAPCGQYLVTPEHKMLHLSSVWFYHSGDSYLDLTY